MIRVFLKPTNKKSHHRETSHFSIVGFIIRLILKPFYLLLRLQMQVVSHTITLGLQIAIVKLIWSYLNRYILLNL